jgi:FKBP-type peptidyl-prolyl cis-trans isomerase (trigger factor)
MITALTRLPKSTVELTITIPWADIKSEYDRAIIDLGKELELPGFRKGKAPKSLVEKSIDKSKLRETVLSKIIPQAYTTAINQQNLKPIVNPQIKILGTEEGKDWIIRAMTCEIPPVDLGNYKQEIEAFYTKDKIWVPGKSEKKPEEENQKKEDYLQKVLDILLKSAKVEVPDMLTEEETNKLLVNLLDQIQKLGLTVEQYLSARKITSEGLRAFYAKQAQTTLALEFILLRIAQEEHITVDDKEIDVLIEKTTDPKQKETLKNERSYVSAILLRQKTLDRLVRTPTP